MADGFVVVETTIPTGTGMVDLLATGGQAFGSLPTGAIVLLASATATGSSAVAQRSVGMVDGTRWGGNWNRVRDGVTVATAGVSALRTGATTNVVPPGAVGVDNLLTLTDPITTGVAFGADFDSFVTDGLRISVHTNTFLAPLLVRLLLFYGDTECEFTAINPGTSTGTPFMHDFSTLSGEPSLLVFSGDAGYGGAAGGAGQNHGIGVCTFDEGAIVHQGSVATSASNLSPTNAHLLAADGFAYSQLTSGGTISGQIEVTALSGTEVTIVRRTAGGATLEFGVLAVRFAGLEARSGLELTDTDALPHTQSVAAGLSVEGGMLLGTRATAEGAVESGASAWSECIGLFGPDETVVAVTHEDGVTTLNASTYLGSEGYAVPDNAGAFTAGSAHLASVTPTGTGFDLAYSVTDTATPRVFLWLAWGSEGVSIPESLELVESVVPVNIGLESIPESLELVESISTAISSMFRAGVDKVRTIKVAAPTSGATFQVTIPGFGLPNAAVVHVVQEDTEDSAEPGLAFGSGMTDGMLQRAVGIFCQDAAATSNAHSFALNDSLAALVDASKAFVFRASFKGWVTDGLEMIVHTPASAGWFLVVTLISAPGVQLVEVTTPHLAGTGSVGVVHLNPSAFNPSLAPHVSLQPTFLWSATSHMPFAGAGDASAFADHARISLGRASYDRTSQVISQGSLNWFSRDAQARSTVAQEISTNRIARHVDSMLLYPQHSVEVTAMGPAGLELTTQDSNGATVIALLVCSFAGRSHVEVREEAQALGSEQIVVGWQPQWSDRLGQLQLVTDAQSTALAASTWFYGACDIEAREHMLGARDQDNSDPTITRSHAGGLVHRTLDVAGTLRSLAGFVAMGSQGLFQDWLQVHAGFPRWYLVALVENQGGPVTLGGPRLGSSRALADLGASSAQGRLGAARAGAELGASAPTGRLGVARPTREP